MAQGYRVGDKRHTCHDDMTGAAGREGGVGEGVGLFKLEFGDQK